jgi:hypothetical protein
MLHYRRPTCGEKIGHPFLSAAAKPPSPTTTLQARRPHAIFPALSSHAPPQINLIALMQGPALVVARLGSGDGRRSSLARSGSSPPPVPRAANNDALTAWELRVAGRSSPLLLSCATSCAAPRTGASRSKPTMHRHRTPHSVGSGCSLDVVIDSGWRRGLPLPTVQGHGRVRNSSEGRGSARDARLPLVELARGCGAGRRHGLWGRWRTGSSAAAGPAPLLRSSARGGRGTTPTVPELL